MQVRCVDGPPLIATPSCGEPSLPLLRGKLVKRHKRNGNADGSGKPSGYSTGYVDWRYFEVDDGLGVMYQFKSAAEMQRRLPHHCYALGMEGAAVESLSSETGGRLTGRVSKSFASLLTTFVSTYGFRITLTPSFSLFLGTAELEERYQWINGLQKRRDLGRLTSKFATLTVPGAGDAPSALARVGVQCANLPWSPIGVALTHVQEDSSAHSAGLRVGDALVAVGEDEESVAACLSHSHAANLLATCKGRESDAAHPLVTICLLFTPGAAKTGSSDEAVDVS